MYLAPDTHRQPHRRQGLRQSRRRTLIYFGPSRKPFVSRFSNETNSRAAIAVGVPRRSNSKSTTRYRGKTAAAQIPQTWSRPASSATAARVATLWPRLRIRGGRAAPQRIAERAGNSSSPEETSPAIFISLSVFFLPANVSITRRVLDEYRLERSLAHYSGPFGVASRFADSGFALLFGAAIMAILTGVEMRAFVRRVGDTYQRRSEQLMLPGTPDRGTLGEPTDAMRNPSTSRQRFLSYRAYWNEMPGPLAHTSKEREF